MASSHTESTFAPVAQSDVCSGPKQAGKKSKKAKTSKSELGEPPKNAKEYWQQHYTQVRKSRSNPKRKAAQEPSDAPPAKRQHMSVPDDKSEAPISVKTAEDAVIVKTEEPVIVKTEEPVFVKIEENVATGLSIRTEAQKEVDEALQQLEDRLDKTDAQAWKDFEDLRQATQSFGVDGCTPVKGKWKLKGFKTSLYNHQLIGVRWMCSREFLPRGPNGGILADEMGLGKTVQLLACMSQNQPRKGAKATKTLIIAPEKLLMQWYREIQDHCDAKGLRVFIYKKANAAADTQCTFNDIIITNYAQIQRQAREGLAICERLEESEGLQESREISVKEKLHEHGPSLFRINFHRIVLDEAHAINNRDSSTSLACRYLTGKHRWILTGTPMTNATDEVFPYLDFLGTKYKRFDTFVEDMGAMDSNPTNMEQLQTMLSELTLRRRVDAKLMGAPILQIPRALPVETITVNFSPFELMTYVATDQKHMSLVKRRQVYKAAGQPPCGEDKGEMQKAADHLQFFTSHPALVEPTWFDNQALQAKDMLPQPLEVKCNCFCRHCWRVVTPCSKLADCGHLFCASCFGNLKARYHNKEEEACCPSCNNPVGSGKSGKGSCSSHQNMPSLPSPRKGTHTYRHFGDDDVGTQPRFAIYQQTTGKETMKKSRRRKSTSRKGTSGRNKPRPKKKSNQKRGMPQTVQRTRLNALKFLKKVDSCPWEPVPHSAKTKATIDLVNKWQNEAPTDKIIIFVQWIPMLSILGRLVTQSGYRFVYFWGELDQNDQERALERFKKVPDVKIMLASVTCTAHGLNLTVANRAIMYDHWWNVCRQWQAFGRVHRIGQTKTVHTAKIVAAGSVDERIIHIQEAKETAISGIMDGLGEIKKRPISVAKEILGWGDLSDFVVEDANTDEEGEYLGSSDDEDEEETTDSESESTSDETDSSGESEDESGSESGSGSGSDDDDDEDEGEHSGSESG
ncbi:SNF2 family N-terminal domain-containing protein [Cercophora samala]|uniref:SNF2 family N-terminal domain-containing protein n=1 Tax=Cercophora samala TaxID=330535 RepID=A0AA40DBS4_9PEZI|nr:SNF2 family N-terminal domain-containing protein [Cercophora samala]